MRLKRQARPTSEKSLFALLESLGFILRAEFSSRKATLLSNYDSRENSNISEMGDTAKAFIKHPTVT